MSKAWVIAAVSAAAVFGLLSLKAQQTADAAKAPAGASATATNLPAAKSTNATADVVEPKVAKDPGASYTNVLGMQLLQVGDFWAGKFEVTQAEFQKVMGSNPSAFSGATRPVDSVNYDDAMEFCQKLTDLDIAATNLPAGYAYTLPTEAQWEALVGDATVDNAVTSMNGRRTQTEPVGSLGPNSLGLYDTRGNVLEFTLSDPSSAYRVLRGGSWQDFIEINLRVVFRNYCPPEDRKNTYGFRCILEKRTGN